MSARRSLYTNPKPCQHLSDFKRKYGDGVNCYFSSSILQAIPTGNRDSTSGKIIPRCRFCNVYEGRSFFCLICSLMSCSNHYHSHLKSNNGHDLALDVDRAELYCYSCNDQVYDPDFDKLVVRKQIMEFPTEEEREIGGGGGGDDAVERSSKRRKLDFDLDLDLDLDLDVKEFEYKRFVPMGLRGLNNLGSTCFMNSILQALIHAPPLRNYFMNGQHNHDECRSKNGNENGNGNGSCLMCAMDLIFSSIFSGHRKPYSPASFLYSWWQQSENYANYEEQDCHEFFISVLDGMHESEEKLYSPHKDNEDCKCIAHRVFSGLLKSDVTCMTCGYTSTTYDPCIDISLNLDTTKDSPTQKNILTLFDCLDFFTRSENLGSDQKLHCKNCKEKRDSIKQMSVRRLPLVLCLHIKRFEHFIAHSISRKIDRYLQFPVSLDMTPYLSSSILRSEFGNRIYPFEGQDMDASAEYEIFAVITHSGMMDSGHYLTYLRLKNQWFKCDDAWISEVDEAVVRATQCYMLFYAQKMVCSVSPWTDPLVRIDGCY